MFPPPFNKKIPALSTKLLEPLFSKRSSLYSACQAFNLKAIPANEPLPSPGCTATVVTGKKSISKHSVIRYRAARRLKAAITNAFPTQAPSGYHYIFYALPPAVNLPFSTIQNELARVLADLNKKMNRSSTRPMTRKPSQK